jgi:rhodanese-related sulfurtransferase
MNTTNWIIFAIVIIGGIAAAYWWFKPSSGVKEITPSEADRFVRGGALFLDVRQPVEYRRGHAKGARLAPLTSLSRADLGRLSTDQPVVLICASGHRSATAARRLKSLGYTQTLSVRGGTPAWASAKLPMEEKK